MREKQKTKPGSELDRIESNELKEVKWRQLKSEETVRRILCIEKEVCLNSEEYGMRTGVEVLNLLNTTSSMRIDVLFCLAIKQLMVSLAF